MKLSMQWEVGLATLFLFSAVMAQETSPKRVLVFRPDQDAVAGKLIDVQAEHIVVLTQNREESIPLSQVRRVILRSQSGAGHGALYGAVMGGYASMYLFGTREGQGSYVDTRTWSPFGILLLVIPSIAVGAGVGYLVDPGSSEKEELFDFTGDEQSRENSRVKLKRAVEGGASLSKVHFVLQGSQINKSMPSPTLPSSYPAYDYITSTDFNLLRRLQLSYSILPELEAGVAVVWVGEPIKTANGYETISSSQSNSYFASQSFESIGKFAVVAYRPLADVLDHRMDFRIGGGVGFVSVDFKRETNTSMYDSNNPVQQPPKTSQFVVAENWLGQYLFIEFNFNIDDRFSLGIVADKIFLPSKDAPAVPEAKIPAQLLNFGNASVGFTIGVHF